MKDVLKKYKNMKPEKRKIILLISLLIITISVTYAFFAPLIGEGVTTNINTQTGLTDDLYFESGNTLSITADQFNFAEGKGNLSDTTTASAYLRANTGNKSAFESYTIYLNIIKNEYIKTDSEPELLLNIYDPQGQEIVDLNSLEYTSYCEDDCVEGYDITELKNKTRLIFKYDIESNSSSEYTIQDWRFKITFINGNWDQSENAGKNFEAEIIMEHVDKLDPIMAIYSEDDFSLRFYQYDEAAVAGEQYNNLTVTEIYTGIEYSDYNIIYDKNKRWVTSPWYGKSIKSVIVEEEIMPENTKCWFTWMRNLESLDLSKLNTSKTRDMTSMFQEIYLPSDLIIPDSWDVSNVENMTAMFSGVTVDKKIVLPGTWDTQNLETIHEMFYGANASNPDSYVIELPVNWNLSKVTDISYTFAGICPEIESFVLEDVIKNITNLDTSNIKNMTGVFSGIGVNSNAFNLSVPENWDTSNVTNMSAMFENTGASATTYSITIPQSFNTSNVTDMSDMFSYAACNVENFVLENTIKNIDYLDTSKVTNMSEIFWGIGQNSTTFNLTIPETWNTSQVTDMSYMFAFAGESATNVKIIIPSNFDTSNVMYMGGMFFSLGYYVPDWDFKKLVEGTENIDMTKVTDLHSFFADAGKCANTFKLEWPEHWTTRNLTTMYSMFSSVAENVTSFNPATDLIGLEKINTSKVTNMHSLFHKMGKSSDQFILEIPKTWDTSNAINMSGLFLYTGQNATTWSVGDLSNWDVSKATDMSYMFSSAGEKAQNFNIEGISNWNVSNVTDMSSMLENAGKESSNWSIDDISRWNTSNVTNLRYMFANAGLNATYTLDLSSWQVPKVTTYYSLHFNENVESKVIPPVWVS